VQKSLQKICTVIFLSISLHPQSGNNTGCDGSEKGFNNVENKLLKNFSKKVSKRFGGFKNMLYLCNRFQLQNGVGFLKTVL
jgi:hypothetical protein